eukprot:Phypoly_transcript_21863.p1 GENE.Phypoly_transcript_21863~~Phypoly_transcript_21863.p1  ORF type:complete len:111 (+),score=14.13 Phypoly_transcript_21863:233-565(+)
MNDKERVDAWRSVIDVKREDLITLLEAYVKNSKELSTPDTIVAHVPREDWSPYLTALGFDVIDRSPILKQLDNKLKGIHPTRAVAQAEQLKQSAQLSPAQALRVSAQLKK